jgi:hypothetical protein
MICARSALSEQRAGAYSPNGDNSFHPRSGVSGHGAEVGIPALLERDNETHRVFTAIVCEIGAASFGVANGASNSRKEPRHDVLPKG